MLDPLQTDGLDGRIRHSDHRIFYSTTRLESNEHYKWLSFSYRYNNRASAAKFGEWLTTKDWSDLVQLPGSDAKTELYQHTINEAIEEFFPLRTIKRKKRLIKRRKRIFKETGERTPEWKRMKKIVADLIDQRCKVY